MGRNGPFLACSGYPDCTFTQNYTRNDKGRIEAAEPSKDEPTNEVCPECGSTMVKKEGRFGPFLACSGYPACKNTRSLNGNGPGKAEPTGVACPEKGCSGAARLSTDKARQGLLRLQPLSGLHLCDLGQTGSACLPNMRRSICCGTLHQAGWTSPQVSEQTMHIQTDHPRRSWQRQA